MFQRDKAVETMQEEKQEQKLTDLEKGQTEPLEIKNYYR